MGVGVAIDEIFVRLDADIADYKRELRRAVSETSKSAKKIETSVDKSSKSYVRMEKATKAAALAMKSFGLAIAAAFAGALVRDIFQAGVAMDSISRSLKTVTGSAEGAAREFAFVSGEANRLGLNLEKTAGAYTSMLAAAKGTTLEGQGARDIFTAVSEAMLVLGRTSADTEGALRAIEQMISKGNVQAEELRGQLGERLPGAFQIAARAMGKTTQELNKMLDNGEVLASELLPALAREIRQTFGSGVPDAVDSAQAALGRFQTAWFELEAALYGAGGEGIFTNALENLAAFVATIKDAVKWTQKFSDVFGDGSKETSLTVAQLQLNKALQEQNDILAKIAAVRNRTDMRPSVKDNTLAAYNSHLEEINANLNKWQNKKDELISMTGRSAGPYTLPPPDTTTSDNGASTQPKGPKPLTKPRGIQLGNFHSLSGYEDWLQGIKDIIEKAKEEMKKAKEAAAEVLAEQQDAYKRATLSETEYLNQEQAKKLAKYKEYVAAKAITDADYQKAKAQLEAEYDSKRDKIRDEEIRKEKEKAAEIGRVTTQFLNDMMDGWEGVKRIALRAIEAIITKIAEMKTAGGGGGGSTDWIGSIIGAIGGAIGGSSSGSSISNGSAGGVRAPRAGGGAVNAGELYKVNERGTEYFRPNTGGSVVPMRASGGNVSGGQPINVTTNINVSTGVQSTVRAEIKQLMPTITSNVKAAVADGVSRGGAYGKVFSRGS